MNRKQFRELALIRLKEAEILLRKRKYHGAYYLCGYVIECGLKACIAKKTRRHDFPDKKTVEKFFIHNLTVLLGTAGLENALTAYGNMNSNFAVNWSLVKDWNESSRYTKVDRKTAKDFYEAVADRTNGVLKWIEQYW